MDTQPSSPVSSSPPRSHRIASKLASLLTARWLRELLQAIFLIYLARISTATYGEFMLALTLGGILLLVAEFGLNLPLVGFLTQKDGKTKETLTQILLLKLGLLILSYAAVAGFVGWQQYSGTLRDFALIVSLGMGLEALASTFFTALQVQGKQALEGRIRSLAACLGFGYALAALYLGASPLALACFKLLETLVNLMGSAWAVGCRGLWRWPSLSGLGATLRRVSIFAILEVTAILYNKANVFFLQRYGGSEAVAQYSATWQIVDGCSSIASNLILQSILFPLFVRLWEVDRPEVKRLAHASARWLLASALILMLFLIIESDRLIPLIYGGRYGDAIRLQPYLAVTILFSFLHNLAGFLLISMRLERLLVAVYVGGLIFNLAFCALAIPQAPLWGAALAIILTKGGMAFLTFGYIQRRLGVCNLRDLIGMGLAVGLSLAAYSLGLLFLRRGWALLVGILAMCAWLKYYWQFSFKGQDAPEPADLP